MVERAPAGEVNTDRNHIMVLSALFLMLLSILLYLIGLYYARMDYPDYIANYPDTSFASLIHPLIIIAVLLMVTSIYLSMNTRRELFLTSGLILLGIYLWNTNSLIVANARVYDSYWHYMISQVIIDQSQFTSQEITSHTFYLLQISE